MAKGILYLRGETIAAVVQENLCTRSVELVLEHSVNAMLLGLEVGAAIPLPERGVVQVQFEALLGAVEVGIMARMAAAVQGDDGMTTGHLNHPNI